MLGWLTLASAAWAWEPVGYLWPDESLPVPLVLSSIDEDSLPSGFDAIALDAAIVEWERSSCDGYDLEVTGTTASPTMSNDGVNTVMFDDPADSLAAGVIGLTVGHLSNTTLFTLQGEPERALLDADIASNNDVAFVTDDQIAAGTCTNAFSMQANLTHELGHLAGLAHSCDANETCDDTELVADTMYWTILPCESAVSTVEADDRAGMAALYGQGFGAVCDPSIGHAPLTVDCDIDGRDPSSVIANWDFGDGGGTGLSVDHSYTTAGTYALTVCGTAGDGSCVDGCLPVETVAVCPDLLPHFDTELAGGNLQWRFANETDDSVAGCIVEWHWRVVDEQGAEVLTSDEWEPDLQFPGLGVFDVTLTVVGFDGVEESITLPLTITAGGDTDVTPPPPDNSCGCKGGDSSLVGLGALALLLVRRRR